MPMREHVVCVCVHSCVSVCGSAKHPPDVDSSQDPEQCLKDLTQRCCPQRCGLGGHVGNRPRGPACLTP